MGVGEGVMVAVAVGAGVNVCIAVGGSGVWLAVGVAGMLVGDGGVGAGAQAVMMNAINNTRT